MGRELEDQLLVFQAILAVKAELQKAVKNNKEDWMVIGEITVRLSNLYSLLDLPLIENHINQDLRKVA